ncbi:MAG: nucleotidyltransferase domain-containing protein, partial [Patescibacteria group bacterium]
MDQNTLSEVKKILFKYLDQTQYRAFIFGSRADNSAQKFSDIDIGIEGNQQLPAEAYFDILDAFENSDIPYLVDVVDFSQVSDKFKQVAKA